MDRILSEEEINKIENITISSSITTIKDSVFDNFSNLKNVEYGGVSEPVCSKTLFPKTEVKGVDVPMEYGLFCGVVAQTRGSCGEGCSFVFNHNTKNLKNAED